MSCLLRPSYANLRADQQSGQLDYGVSGRGLGLLLSVEGPEDERRPYTLLVGRNNPDILKGTADPKGLPVVRPAIEVHVSVNLSQITTVDQRAENFGAVAAINMRWRDPNYAFSTERCQCRHKMFNEQEFQRFLAENNLNWPQFVISNQQGNRWAQRKFYTVAADGQARYFEQFSATLQAPEFDFRHFPLDKQTLYIRIESLSPREQYIYLADKAESALGSKLGEEEWLITNYQVRADNSRETARFVYRFEAQRHIVYYILRMLIPIVLIILIAWFTFFLKDYGKRIDITGANLLAFIAFNFTIASALPRLGYITLADLVLIVTFVVCALLVMLNVYLKRQETLGNTERLMRIDRWIIWLYPLAYIVPVFLLYQILRIFGWFAK